jgi:hypothetical protein
VPSGTLERCCEVLDSVERGPGSLAERALEPSLERLLAIDDAVRAVHAPCALACQ